MRSLLLCCTFLLAVPAWSQNTNVAFRSKVTYPGQTLANIWGYADNNGKEYALVGALNGTSIVDVTNPANPVQIVQIPGASSQWHEIKTYSHYAYVVSEGGFGVQIIDLSNLPAANLPYHSYFGNGAIGQPNNPYLTKAHALHIDESTGYLYLYGSNLFGGKAIVLDLNVDPYNPTYVNYVNLIGYVHDGYVNNDILYAAHIYAGVFSVINMADKNNPMLLGTQGTPNAFPHNTWPNGSTLFTTDETSNSYLTAYDVSNPGNINLLDKIQSNPGSNSIVHNTYIKDDYAITSWYKDGFTITDVSRPANLVQVGNFDTYTAGSGNGFEGAWGVYPYLPSGTILVSNIASTSGGSTGEMWVLTPTYIRGCYVEGTVTSANTGQPLNGVKVQLLSTTTSENTASNGQYKMGQLQSGAYTAQISKSGYITQNIAVTLSNGVLTTLNVALLAATLPVELIDFSVRAEGNHAQLQWRTATETDNAGFEVQHSRDGTNWLPLGFVPALGNGNAGNAYRFETADLTPGAHYFRLRQTDRDGQSQLSPVRTVQLLPMGLQAVLLPNITQDHCVLQLRTAQPETVAIEILRADGQSTGRHWVLQVEKVTDLPISVADLPAGMYCLSLQTKAERQIVRLIKN